MPTGKISLSNLWFLLLTQFYSVCVMFVTFFDSCMVSLAALIVWRLPYYVVFLPWLVFACLDGVYLSASLVKVPDGAWFTLLLSGIITCFLILWRFGKESQWHAEAEDRFPTTHLVEKGDGGAIKLTQLYGGDDLTSIKGFGIFFDKAGETTPAVFTQFLSKLVAAPEVRLTFLLYTVLQYSNSNETKHLTNTCTGHGILPPPPPRDTLYRPGRSLHRNPRRDPKLLPARRPTRLHGRSNNARSSLSRVRTSPEFHHLPRRLVKIHTLVLDPNHNTRSDIHASTPRRREA